MKKEKGTLEKVAQGVGRVGKAEEERTGGNCG